MSKQLTTLLLVIHTPPSMQQHLQRKTRLHAVAAQLEAVDMAEKYLDVAQNVATVPVARHAYGGPHPFGIGMGLRRVAEDARELMPSLDSKAQSQKAEKQLKRALIANSSLPVLDLPKQLQAEVEERRLQVRYSKFWGLMNEVDRPWQRDVILHLCNLHGAAGKRYRELKPATLQKVIANRCQVERQAAACYQKLEQHFRLFVTILSMAPDSRHPRGNQPDISFMLKEGLEVKGLVGTAIACTQAALQQAASFGDTDYVQYVEQILVALQELRSCCDILQQACYSHSKPSRSNRAGWHLQPAVSITQMMKLPELSITWRYPPVPFARGNFSVPSHDNLQGLVPSGSHPPAKYDVQAVVYEPYGTFTGSIVNGSLALVRHQHVTNSGAHIALLPGQFD